MRSRNIANLLVLGLLMLLSAGCESMTSNIPPVTPALARAGGLKQADLQMLTKGRSVLLDRCIQCHAPPDAAKFSPQRMGKILGFMSSRAHLSPEEHEAVLKYLLAVRSL